MTAPTLQSDLFVPTTVPAVIAESRDSFTVDPHIIFDLIKRQSGTIVKAVLELITNGVDSRATRIDVLLPESGEGFEVIDDGEGFKSAEEVGLYYKRFGFRHDDDQYRDRRIFGAMGLGRGQVWAWASTTYVTNHMEIDTDVKRGGLDYTLREYPSLRHRGCRVVGKFYEKQDRLAIQNTIRDLKRWARFLSVPVSVNGVLVTEPAVDIKWSLEDDDAYYLFNSDSSLSIYNMGMFVCDQSQYVFGTGGLIVSKKALTLDMGRTQLLDAVCPVWRSIKSKVKALHRNDAVKRKALTDAQRASLISGLLAGEVDLSEVFDSPLLVTIKGRGMSINELGNAREFTICSDQDRTLGDHLHSADGRIVLAPKTVSQWSLFRGGSNTADALLIALRGLIRTSRLDIREKNTLARVKPIEFSLLKDQYRGDQRCIGDAELSLRASAILSALRQTMRWVNATLAVSGHESGNRALRAGVSTTAEGWTDGKTFIALETDQLEAAWVSEAGMRKLYFVIVHEMLHSESSEAEHLHDHTFYQSFHDIVIDHADREVAFIRLCAGRLSHLVTLKTFRRLRTPPAWVLPYLSKGAREGFDAGTDGSAHGSVDTDVERAAALDGAGM